MFLRFPEVVMPTGSGGGYVICLVCFPEGASTTQR